MCTLSLHSSIHASVCIFGTASLHYFVVYRDIIDYCKLGLGIGELCDLVHKLSRRPCAETRLNCTFQPCQGGTFMVMIRSELSKLNELRLVLYVISQLNLAIQTDKSSLYLDYPRINLRPLHQKKLTILINRISLHSSPSRDSYIEKGTYPILYE